MKAEVVITYSSPGALSGLLRAPGFKPMAFRYNGTTMVTWTEEAYGEDWQKMFSELPITELGE